MLTGIKHLKLTERSSACARHVNSGSGSGSRRTRNVAVVVVGGGGGGGGGVLWRTWSSIDDTRHLPDSMRSHQEALHSRAHSNPILPICAACLRSPLGRQPNIQTELAKPAEKAGSPSRERKSCRVELDLTSSRRSRGRLSSRATLSACLGAAHTPPAHRKPRCFFFLRRLRH